MNKWNILNNLYMVNNLKIFPIVKNGKTPLIDSWQKECSSDYLQILYWYENAKDCNWALPANENNLFVIDLDVHDENKNGIINFKKLCDDIGLDDSVYNTLVQETPSGGRHLIYKSDDDLKNVANTSNSFANYPGIDVRTTGYIVVEPSMINNNEYKFTNDSVPQEMPVKLKEFILNNSDKRGGKQKIFYDKPKRVEVGDRDTSIFEYINRLYFKTDLDYDEILVLANYFNEEILAEPFSEKTVEYKVKKAFEKERGCKIIIKVGDVDEER